METNLPDTPDTAVPKPQRQRRWLQFSLRTLLIVVTIIAVGMGLLMRQVHEQRAIVQREKEAVAEIEKLGGEVIDGYKYRPILTGFPNWLRAIFGDQEYRPVERVIIDIAQITDIEFQYICHFTQLKELSLNSYKITDTGLQHLSQLTNLQKLDLTNASITNHGLLQFNKLNELQELCLSYTKITDMGLQHLSHMTALKKLYLIDTSITDAGLKYLSQLTALEYLDIQNTKVTENGVAEIKVTLPNIIVRWSPR